jgi:hypothetical protein
MPPDSLAIFTSIPPKVQRQDRRGAEIGQSYTQRCIASWVAAGHRVVSVNTPEEIAKLGDRFVGVEFLPVERSAVATIGRPLIYMSDLLEACASAPEDAVGITNADIYLHAPERLRAVLPRIDGRTLIYAQRLDVDDLDDPSEAEPYSFGMDCFLFSPSMVANVGDEGFIFGECWWDYWLPIVAAKRGYRLELVDPPPFLKHLRHGDGLLGSHVGHYFDGFASFWRSVSMRLPLPGADPWTAQANTCFIAFLKHFNPSAEPAEGVILLQFLGHVLKLYLHQDPDLIATIRQVYDEWRFNPAYPISPRLTLAPLFATIEQGQATADARVRVASDGAAR